MATDSQTKNKTEQSIPSYRSTGFKFTINKQLNYPLKDKGDHFVRFYINLDEESRMFTELKLEVLGNVDQTDQNRLRRKPVDQDTFNIVAAAGGAIKGAQTGSQIGKNFNAAQTAKGLKGFLGNAKKGLAIQAAAATITGLAGGSIAYALANEIKVNKKLKRLATQITLYSPATITNSQKTSWDNYNDSVFELMQIGALNDEEIKQMSGSGVAAAMGRIIATAASDLVQSATRTVVNPKKDLLFKGIERRDFTFDYQFVPRSAAEAEEVANIIQTFRLFSAPEVVQGTDNFLYTYPAEFDIEYIFNKDGVEEQNKYINKISSCVLESVLVNYSPNGSFQSLQNGEPVQVNMTLHFKEIETLHRDRIVKGY